MKKVLIGIVVLVLVFVIGCWILLSVRESQSQKALVHSQTSILIDVSIDDILTDIAFNSLANPGYYLKDSTKVSDGEKKIRPWNMGWKLPAHFYFFSLPNDSTALYSVQEITSIDEFKVFVQQKLKLSIDSLFDQQSYTFYSSEDKRVSLLLNDKQFAIAISQNQNDKSGNLLDLLTNQSLLISVKDIEITNKNNSDIAYYDLKNQNSYGANFKKGKVIVDGQFTTALWQAPKVESSVRELPLSNPLNFYLNADIRPLLRKHQETLANYGIPVDTLVAYYGGYVDVQLREGSVKQTDTIVTYDLDDNFEMTAKEEVQETEVPNIELGFKASTHLKNYLPEKMFYKFNKQQIGEYLLLGTDQANNPKVATHNTPYYFSLSVLPQKVKLPFLSSLSDFLNKFEKIDVQVKNTQENKSELSGEFLLKKKSIHALYQLL
ncbi:hypothetical protein [Sphingobacterium hungaricum]|uniref:Uncharacterized protein n=1 Tax=Sphingobacterium hungaricum TaxID=2082723 RepID=A0A928YNU1_9SPHI|nr:hypothetical protein [Sphingobacterium hungaricum]MBE8712229.1 hypothetical protein [Sphingobacterium hungaricum]